MKDWNAAPILSARNLTRRYGEHIGCRDVSFDLWPGEVLGIVGESGSGKSTLLNMLSGRMEPTSGTIAYRDAAGRERNIHALPEGEKRRLLRSELGFVHQRPSDGLRMQVSAGANIGERLMAEGARHYGTLRGRACNGWSGWRSTPGASTTSPPSIPGECSSACKSPGTSSRRRVWCSWTSHRRP